MVGGYPEVSPATVSLRKPQCTSPTREYIKVYAKYLDLITPIVVNIMSTQWGRAGRSSGVG